jgi:hypothetical protein
MMANIRFLYDNRWSAFTSTITALSEALALPPAASQNPDRTYLYRSLMQSGTQALDCDLGSVMTISSVAVANLRLLGTGTLKLQHRGDTASPGTAVDVATLPMQDAGTRVAVLTFDPRAHRHWRLLWTNPTSVSDYAEVGYVHLGPYFEPLRNVEVPIAWRVVDPSIKTPSVDGQLTTTQRSAFRAGTFTFRLIRQTDRDAFVETLYAAVGTRLPIFTVLESSLPWTMMLARIASDIRAEFLRAAAGWYEVEFDWEEAR